MENRIIKLIWDFKGEDSEETAKHHIIHLKEFSIKEKLILTDTKVNRINDNHLIAYLLVMESEVFSVRDAWVTRRADRA